MGMVQLCGGKMIWMMLYVVGALAMAEYLSYYGRRDEKYTSLQRALGHFIVSALWLPILAMCILAVALMLVADLIDSDEKVDRE
jgi:formate-dependent nitrite reductase membrane component NrfD